MKGAWIAFFIALGLLILSCFVGKIHNTSGTIDIQLNNTYLVLSYTSVIVFVFLFLGTFFSVGGIIGSHFKSYLFWVLLLLFFSIDIYYIVTFFNP
jgi:hypothetical protein